MTKQHQINDLSHLSEEEFIALCPQGEHAPGAEPLSPAAQAVASAYDNTPEKETGNHRYLWLAAAIRAAADQVVPEPNDLDKETLSFVAIRRRMFIRDRFLAIATELEAQP